MMKGHFMINVNLHYMIILSVYYHNRLKDHDYCPITILKVLDKHLFEAKDIWNVDETSTVTVQVFSSV